VLATYVFAIAMTQLSIGTEFRETYFQGVALSMYTLFIHGTFLDSLSGFVDAVREESTVCLATLTVFAVLSALTLLNMLIGVLCEVVSAIASTEKEGILTAKVHSKFDRIIRELDTNGNHRVSWSEVAGMAEHPEAANVLASVNVSLVDMIEIAEDAIFTGGNQRRELTFDEFMEMALGCRNTQTAVMRDVTVLSKRFNRKASDLKDAIGNIESKLNTLIERRSAMQQPQHAKVNGSGLNLSTTAAPEAAPRRPREVWQEEHGRQRSKDAPAECGGEVQTAVASTKIQATYRGHRTRCQFHTMRESCRAISEDDLVTSDLVMSELASQTNCEQPLAQNDEDQWSSPSVAAMLLEVDLSGQSGSCTTGLSVEHLCHMASAELEHLRGHDEAARERTAQEAASRVLVPTPTSTFDLLAEEQARLLAEPIPPSLPGQMPKAEELL